MGLQNVTVEETFAANSKPHPELLIVPTSLAEEQSPCGSEAEGLSPRTSDAGDCDVSLSASSSCSLGSSTDLSATTSSPSASTSPVLFTVSSFAERPVALTSSQAEGKPRAQDTPEPPCRCPTTTTTTTTTTVNTTTTAGNTVNTTTSPSAAAPCTRRPAQASMLSPEELLQVLRLINGVYEIYNAQGLRQLKRLSDALKQLEGKKKLEGCPVASPVPGPAAGPGPDPAGVCTRPNEEAAPAPASPRDLPAEEAEAGKEPSTAAPSEEPAAKPPKGLKHKLSKLLRGLFGGCVGRNVE
ncbi:hypothetical protein PLESTB_001351800 [Pleodorina starrii]|uniref:Uncharacterized protein n=1 Tax=Pleodorina starrii TaxID=330485 RepID=A0A9W6BV55_9CHLO|nr:hypothetical protein PLESTB_001351800 [Pleodorina starrii]